MRVWAIPQVRAFATSSPIDLLACLCRMDDVISPPNSVVDVMERAGGSGVKSSSHRAFQTWMRVEPCFYDVSGPEAARRPRACRSIAGLSKA